MSENVALGADGRRLRLLHVHAHPDDESSKGAASTARYVAEGVQVLVATCTGGERGDVLNPSMDRPEVYENLTQIRHEEMKKARDILGVAHVSLGFIDSGLPEGDPVPPLPEGCFALETPETAAIPLVRAIREFRPHVLTTYDEQGGYPHPDHIQCHRVAIAAVRLAADAGFRPDLGEAYEVAKVYYQLGFHRARWASLHQAMIEANLESPFTERLRDWKDQNYEQRVTTRVECADYFEIRDQALLAHASQIDPNGFWFSVPLEIQAAAWPTEDFQLVRSTVPTTIPETDLFAGLRPSPPTVPSLAEVFGVD